MVGMQAETWMPVRKLYRKLGPVWVVKRKKDGRTQMGYFKFPCKQNQYRVGNLIVNEMISFRLAKLLGLNVAEVELAEIDGKQGIVSIVKPAASHFTWLQFQRRLSRSPVSYLRQPEQLRRTFVFDVWICNVDRHGGNLITFPKGDRFDFYLIDHGVSLLGAMKWRKIPWDSPYWQHISRYNYHYPGGMRSYIRSYSELLPHIKDVERIPEYEIREIVNELPDAILPREQKALLVKMLLSRQKQLRSIIWRWCVEQRKGTSQLKQEQRKETSQLKQEQRKETFQLKREQRKGTSQQKREQQEEFFEYYYYQ
jgi:hypothetical protein